MLEETCWGQGGGLHEALMAASVLHLLEMSWPDDRDQYWLRPSAAVLLSLIIIPIIHRLDLWTAQLSLLFVAKIGVRNIQAVLPAQLVTNQPLLPAN